MSADEHTDDTRRLVVFRHAKSDWPANVADHDRPLAPRGKQDAPAAGRWLRSQEWQPDHVVCSTAKRARQTWLLAAEQMHDPPHASYDERVYHAGAGELVDVLRELDDDPRTVVLVGHNPSLQELVLDLADDGVGDTLRRARTKFSTAALAVLTVPDPWPQLVTGKATLAELVVPRSEQS